MGDHTDFVQEEPQGSCSIKILAPCVVEHVSTYVDILTLGIFGNFEASFIFTWVSADTASAACPDNLVALQ